MERGKITVTSDRMPRKPEHDWDAHIETGDDRRRIAELERDLAIWIESHKMLSDRFLDFRQRTAFYEVVALLSTIAAILSGIMLLLNAI